jgi:hypothetical protein
MSSTAMARLMLGLILEEFHESWRIGSEFVEEFRESNCHS